MDAKEYYQALRDVESAKIEELVKKALDAGLPAPQILNDGLIGGMTIIGQEFKCRDLWVPDVLLAARNMHRGIELLKPFFSEGTQGAKGKIVLGTVKGDIHDIGKNLVSIMMSGSGFEVIDLGIDVPLEKFMAAAAGAQTPDHRPFRPPDYHDDGNEQGHRSGKSQFPVAQTTGDDRRSAGYGGVCQGNRGRRLRRGRGFGSGGGIETGRERVIILKNFCHRGHRDHRGVKTPNGINILRS